MAYESVNITENGETKTVSINVADYYQREAGSALTKISEMRTIVEEFIELLDKQKELIPEHYGEKDELGENIDKCIDDIKKETNDNILEKIDEIESNKGTIKEKAHDKDVSQAISTYLSNNSNQE